MVAVARLAGLGHSSVSACAALSMPRSSYYRSTGHQSPAAAARGLHPSSLTLVERAEVVAELTSERFSDVAIPEVHATLLDEGRYLCSKSTMYRLLNAAHLLTERRRQVSRTHYPRPELLAVAPNQVWSWDISVPQKAA